MTESVMAFNEGILADLRPNFFELLAEEEMHESLRPAVEYVCKVVSHARPDKFGVLWRLRDELYLFLETALQWRFLRACDGSFSEYFYCLKREYVRGSHHSGGRDVSLCLTSRQRLLSTLCLVFVPYLKLKLERLHSVLTAENDSTQITWSRGQSAKHLLKLLMFKLIPYLQSLWTACLFVFRFRYLIGGSAHYSPLHWLAGVSVVRQTEKEMSSLTGGSSVWLSHLLSVCLFCLKLVQWWYSGERETAVRKMSSLPVPPPPPRVLPSHDGVPLPSNPRLCPLCHRSRQDPTSLTTSGYVFCYDCIAGYVTNFGKCPLTMFPSSHRQLVRLFVEPQHQQ